MHEQVVGALEGAIIIAAILGLIILIIYNLRGENRKLIHNIYVAFSGLIISWLACILCMRFTPPDNQTLLYVWDSLSNFGGAFVPVLALLVAICFVHNGVSMPKWSWLLLIVPTVTVIMVWTNPLHHLHYEVFSVFTDEVKFGPYMMAQGIYSYVCLIASMVILLNFGLRNRSIYFLQSLTICVGNLIPALVSMAATFKWLSLSIAATPIAFLATVLLHSIAIYKLNFLNIAPIAIQNVLDNISDGYLIVSDTGRIVDYNNPFYATVGKDCGFHIGKSLDEISESEGGKLPPVQNLMETMRECAESGSVLAYEQNIVHDGTPYSYSVEITPIRMDDRQVGFVAMFKDVTRLKENMQKLRRNESMLMEREQLASLGQLIGGIAHNLKTPIMSISGCAASLENLIEEYRSSIGDPEVNDDDHREIAAEMQNWVDRIRPSCAYMSDIITAVKGQAVQLNTSSVIAFTASELMKRVKLLTRHEFIKNRCNLITEIYIPDETSLHGDINNLVQVLNNMVINAVDSYRGQGGTVKVVIRRSGENAEFAVIDNGCGIPAEVASKLLKEMVTSKGTLGTGIGLYVSNAVIRGKFGGKMWFEPNPEGGTIFRFSIPLNIELGENGLPGREQ